MNSLYPYEMLVIIDPRPTDEEVAALLNRLVENLKNLGGQVGKAEKVANRGFDAESLEYVDMLEAGIIDPTKVERVALQNAASVASLLLTTEALVSDLPEEKPAAAPPMPHGDMY